MYAWLIRNVSLKWRIVAATLFPVLLSTALIPFLGLLAGLIGIAVALIVSLIIGTGTERFFKRITASIMRIRSIDRAYRLPADGSYEEARLARAVNRLADRIDALLSGSIARRLYYETILNEMNDCILVVSSDGILQYSNLAAREMLDFEDAFGESSQLASKVNIYEINDAASVTCTSSRPCRRAIELYNPLRYMEVVSTPIPSGNSQPVSALLIVRDRTSEFRVSETMREFVANASHELRTPLAAVQACVETLKLGAADDPSTRNEFLDRIEDSAGRMAILISELMELSLLESGRVTMHITLIGSRELLEKLHSQFEPIAQRKKIELQIQYSAEELFINADHTKLERVFINLVSNALKFTPEGGQVIIACTPKDGRTVLISVRDNGPGIDIDDMPHIFERFYKAASTAHDDPTSFGLGLAIAKNIVELHGGKIYAQSVLGQGTTFAVELDIDRVTMS